MVAIFSYKKSITLSHFGLHFIMIKWNPMHPIKARMATAPYSRNAANTWHAILPMISSLNKKIHWKDSTREKLIKTTELRMKRNSECSAANRFLQNRDIMISRVDKPVRKDINDNPAYAMLAITEVVVVLF